MIAPTAPPPPAAAPLAAAPLADPAVAAIGTLFTGLFATLDGWRDALAGHPWPAAGPTTDGVDELVRSLVESHLCDVDGLVVGAGFVARPGWIPAAPWHLAWWVGPANTRGGVQDPSVRRLEVNCDPGSESFRDYTALEWWRIPELTGTAHITGPYVDYLCTDEYTLTLTAPVVVSGAFAGVVGVDIYVKTTEAVVLPRLRALGGTATLVNASGRVVVSTDPHRAAGVILRRAGLRESLAGTPTDSAATTPDAAGVSTLPDGATVHRCPGTNLALLRELR